MENSYDLIREAQEGSKQALNLLVANNVRLVWSVVNRFGCYYSEKEDLFQIGVIGFIKAVRNFDTELNLQLSTYAVPMICGEIKKYLRDNGPIKISRSLKTVYMKYKAYNMNYYLKHGKEPSLNEISKELNINTETLVLAINANESLVSLDSEITSDSGENRALIEKIENPASNPENSIEKISLALAIEKLDTKEQQLIRLRYILNKTQAETGKILGMSQVSVSRSEKRVLKKIKEYIS